VFKEDLIGLPEVYLLDSVVAHECPACDHQAGVTIPNVPGLLAAIAVTRAMYPRKLTGVEIKFLRKAIDLTGRDLAAKLDMQPEQVSRWENDRAPMPSSTEKFFRGMVGRRLADVAKAIEFDPEQIENMNIECLRGNTEPLRMAFYKVRMAHRQEAWEQEEAA